MRAGDLTTPALLADAGVLDANMATMSAARPGPALRPHAKAFKCTVLAARLAAAGHAGFCCATVRELEGLAASGLGEDLLLANEVVDRRALARLGALVDAGTARVTVAIDSAETIAAAAGGGVREVIVDVDVGMPRCGCDPSNAGRLADEARAAGLVVRGVMGYEGHAQHVVDRTEREARTVQAMSVLVGAPSEETYWAERSCQ